MPSYKAMNVATLRAECEQRGINHTGMLKKDMISALCSDNSRMQQERANPADNDDDEVDEGDALPGEDDDDGREPQLGDGELDEHSDSGSVIVGSRPLAGGDLDGLSSMQLEILLERERRETRRMELMAERDMRERDWEIEQERRQQTGSTGQVGPGRQTNNNNDVVNLKGLLPTMYDDEPLHFFNCMERVLELNNVEKASWARYVPAQLSQKAQKAFSRLTLSESRDYEQLKAAVLAFYQLDAQTYLKSFRSYKRHGAESYKMALNRQRDLLNAYCESKQINSFDSLFDSVLMEQCLNSLPDEVRKFVWSKQPTNAYDCAVYADIAFEVSKMNDNTRTANKPYNAAAVGGKQPFQGHAPMQYKSKGLNGTDFGKPFSSLHPQPQKGRSGPSSPMHPQNKKGQHGKQLGCYACGSLDHKYAQCGRAHRNFTAPYCIACGNYHQPNTQCSAPATNPSGVYSSQETSTLFDRTYIIPLYLSGMKCTALRDTGNNGHVLVNRALVRPEQIIPGKFARMKGIFDNGFVKRPIAQVAIRSPHFGYDKDILVEVAVTEMQDGIDVNIGNSLFRQYPQLTDLITLRRQARQTDVQTFRDDSTVHITDAQARLSGQRAVNNDHHDCFDRTDAETTRSEPQQMSVTNTPPSDANNRNGPTGRRDDTAGQQTDSVDAVNNDLHTQNCNEQMTAERVNAVTTRSQTHRGERDSAGTDTTDSDISDEGEGQIRNEGVTHDSDTGQTADPLAEAFKSLRDVNITDNTPINQDISAAAANSAFAADQRQDPTLRSFWVRADTGSTEFYEIQGLLYRKAFPGRLNVHEHVLLLPQGYRKEIINLAHDSKFGAHLGVRKTYERIRELFFFPKMLKAIQKHVKCCHECQMTRPVKVNERQPLEPIEILDKWPFEDVTLDIVGPELPRTRHGNRYLLVIICNVTKWVQAYPIRRITSEAIADKMVEFMTTFGISKIWRMDNMAGFSSELFSVLREKLGIKANFSRPYHFSSHGSIERAILTVESILRKFIQENEKTWDELIPFLLFSLRQVPHSGSKFSPSELVFGRKPRDILDVARETYTNGDIAEKKLKMPTVKYIEKLNAGIAAAIGAAKQNQTQAQTKMKREFDKHCSKRELKPGDKALILLPAGNQKISKTWQGPFSVLKKCEHNNYDIQLPRRVARLHINSLRRYETDESEADSGEAVHMIIDDNETDAADEAELMTPNYDRDGGDDDPLQGITLGSQLTPAQRQQVEELLVQYGDSVLTDRLGRTHLTEHVITLTDQIPVYQKPYPIPDSMRDQVEAEIQKMLQNGVIKIDGNTKYCSPIVIVKKPNNEIRICHNFINLNRKTVDEKYGMTNPAELLSRVAGAKILTRLDMKSMYFQLLISAESQTYTGFQTPEGATYSYVSMPQGLKGAPSTCQRLMNNLLRGTHKYCGTLIDDVIVHSMNFEEHLVHLREVLDRLKFAGLTLNRRKCVVATNHLKLFGHILNDGRLTPDEDKVQVIKTWPVPKTKRELKSFVGLTGFFRQYIPRYAQIAFPLTEMLKNDSPNKLKWGQQQQQAFDTLRQTLMRKPVLRAPDPSKPYDLMVDSSKVALSAILLQTENDESDTRYAIAFASRKLSPSERRRPIIELEVMAIIFGLKKYEQWIYNRPVSVFSDHRPLQWLNSLVKHSPKLARFALILQSYNITTTYVPGHLQVADCLTRLTD